MKKSDVVKMVVDVFYSYAKTTSYELDR